MKYLLLFYTISILSGIKLSAQEVDSIFIRREHLTPVGTLHLSGTRYLDQTEISNLAWLEFLHYIRKDSSRAYYEAMLPDTTVWSHFQDPKLVANDWNIDSAFNHDSFTERYLRYPGYRYFPAVGITYHQATEYCKWRSEVVNIKMNERLATAKKPYRVRYKYFLPGIADLEYASRAFSGKHTMDRRTVKWVKTAAPDFDRKTEFWKACVNQPVAITPSGSQVYVQGFNLIGYIFDNGNQWNFYNVLGNVSELTDEEGKSFGGAWIHEMDEIMRHKIFGYTKPEYWLGFRCAATVELIRE